MDHFQRISGAIPCQKIAGEKPTAQPRADVILIVGPDITSKMAFEIESACRKRGLVFRLLGNEKTKISPSDIQELHRSGSIGPDTHIVVCGHGKVIDRTTPGRHVTLAPQGSETEGWNTHDLVTALLTHPDETHVSDTSRPGRGMVHILSCEAGFLKTQFTSKSPAWAKGFCLVHAGNRFSSPATSLPNALAVINLLGDCKQRSFGVPTPEHVLASVAAITGESITLLGGDLKEAQTLRPARTNENLLSDYNRFRIMQSDYEKRLVEDTHDSIGINAAFEGRDQQYAMKQQNVLFRQIQHNKIDAVLSILDAEPLLINAQDVSGRTPLICAAISGMQETALVFIDRKADIHMMDQNGRTALHHACAHRESRVTTILLDNGAKINQQTPMGETPLFLACSSGDIKSVKLLLDKHADPNLSDETRLSPLSVAVKAKHTKIVKLMLDYKIDCNQSDINLNTPLHYSCMTNNTEVANLLINLSPKHNLELKNDRGFTALDYATTNNNTDIISAFTRRSIDLTIKDENGLNALHHACVDGDGALLELIVSLPDVDLDLQTHDGRTPLSLACAQGHISLIDILLKEEVNTEIADNGGRTPLMTACLGARLGAVKKLIAAGADLSAQDTAGFTALMHACRSGNLKVVRRLLENYASLKDVNKAGEKAVQFVTHILREQRGYEETDIKAIKKSLKMIKESNAYNERLDLYPEPDLEIDISLDSDSNSDSRSEPGSDSDSE